MGFEKDKLNREKYADFLTNIIENSEKYKRISDSKSLSISIDSSWGTGKSTFMNMWKEKLEELKDENKKDKFIVITYNAWKNDFCDDPLESLIYSIINHKAFNIENEMAGAEEAGKNLLITGIKLGTLLLKMKMKKEFGEDAEKVIEGVVEAGINSSKNAIDFLNEKTTKMNNFFKEYKEYIENIEEFKRAINNISQKRKIIIMIDELDRCKPLFAIKVLESIKHIFDVENVSFVFALDMEQLSHSIKCVYGQGMNANGYLCRFFDYISKMPKADTLMYIHSLMENKPLIRNTINHYNKDMRTMENINFFDIFQNFAQNMKLSLRDINTIYSNFLIIENLELKCTDCMQAYSLYLMILILKYKYIEVFNKIFIKNDFDINQEEILKNYHGRKNKYFSSETLNFLMNRNIIGEILYSVDNHREIVRNTKIYPNKNGIRYMLNDFESYIISFSENLNISNCLFLDDIKKWEKIKEKTLTEYIQEKLEFFDFEWENKNEVENL